MTLLCGSYTPCCVLAVFNLILMFHDLILPSTGRSFYPQTLTCFYHFLCLELLISQIWQPEIKFRMTIS